MAVSNSITKDINNRPVEYECGNEMVKLTPNIVRDFLVRGNGKVTDQEITMFLNLCKYQHLNPFLNESYLVKYGNQDATIVVGKEALTKRAMRNSRYAGQQAGVVVLKADGTLENRIGTIVVDGEKLLGGWAKIFVKGFENPVEISAAFDEYVGVKKDGTVNSNWSKRPATMIRKVALVQALREAFPEDLGGMYAAEENEIDESTYISKTPAPQTEQIMPQSEAVEYVDAEAEVIEEVESMPDDAAVQQALFGI